MSEEQVHPPFERLASYLAMIEDSVGTEMFRRRYYEVHGESMDVLYDGDLSCAVYVTSVLLLQNCGLITEVHTKVSESIKDMEASEWYKIAEPKPGTIIHWGFLHKPDGTVVKHQHLGFYLDAEIAVSNQSLPNGRVRSHHPMYKGEGRRDIIAYYWHPALDQAVVPHP